MGEGGNNRMKRWSKFSDFEKIFVYLFAASYPYMLHPFEFLLKDLILLESWVMGWGRYKMI